jgi:hypothetical protein
VSSGGQHTVRVGCGRGKAWFWRGRRATACCRSVLARWEVSSWSGSEGDMGGVRWFSSMSHGRGLGRGDKGSTKASPGHCLEVRD